MSKPYRVLLFDDDQEYLSLVEKGADGNPEQPIQWITASTEDEAKSKLLETKGGVDLILIDYLLPRRSGVEFLNSLRQEGHAVPSLLISDLDEKSLLSDIAGKFKERDIEVFSLYIIGYLQKPSNIIDSYPRFVEDIIERDKNNRRHLFNTSMQFIKNTDSFLSDLKLDVATISRALSMLTVHFRRNRAVRHSPQLGSLISAIEKIEANLWEVANKLSDAWRTLRDMAVSGIRIVPSESSVFRPPEIAMKLARDDKRRIRTLLVGRDLGAEDSKALLSINRALEEYHDPAQRVELLRDLVIGVAQVDDDFQLSMKRSTPTKKIRAHDNLLMNIERLLSEKGEEKLSLIVKVLRLKHLKRCGYKREFAFSLDSAFKSSLELPDNYLKREVLSTLQGLIEYEPRQ